MRSTVVLPQPLGPTMQTNSPSATVRVKSASAFVSPNDLASRSIWILIVLTPPPA